MKSKTKLPLIDKPLRYVAQSADEAIDDLLNDKLLGYCSGSVIVIIGMIIGWEWYRYYKPIDIPPVLVTIMAGITCIFCI